MNYPRTVRAKFLDRPNRFLAVVELDGKQETVHVKNTGRCRELLIPQADVVLAEGENPNRKTKYDLIAVYKPHLGWVNIDSQAPNAVVREWLRQAEGVTLVKPEYTFGSSRVDFYVECGERKILLEVKGCTLERDGVGYFPDAPTERGVKHLHELTAAVARGYHACIAFVIPMPEVTRVLPNTATHPAFATALAEAEQAGVRILYLPCKVSENTLNICTNEHIRL